MKIRTKIFLFTTIFITLFSLTMGIFIINRIHESILDEEITSASEEAKMFTSSINFLYLDTMSSSYEYMQTEKLINRIDTYLRNSSYKTKNYVLLNEFGDVQSNRNKNMSISKDSLKTALSGEMSYSLVKEEKEYYLFMYYPIKIDKVTYVFSSRRNLTKFISNTKENYKVFLYGFVVFLLVILTCTFIFSKYITKDIEKLHRVSKEVFRGNYMAKTDITSSDEIGDLAKSFDIMTEEINYTVGNLNKEVKKTQKLFSNLTHEIKTPLTSIIGYADLLRKKEYDREVFDKGLKHIYIQGKRLSRLSSKMIQIVDFNSSSLEVESVMVRNLLAECIEINKYKTYDKEIIFDIAGEDFEVDVDKELIKIVITNLIDNAVKASYSGGTVKLIMKNGITIEDYGVGMDESLQERIFEPFYKGDKSRSKSRDSIGLGLSIAKDIMSLHGNDIEIYSKVNEGTKVKLSFTTPLQVADKLSTSIE